MGEPVPATLDSGPALEPFTPVTPEVAPSAEPPAPIAAGTGTFPGSAMAAGPAGVVSAGPGLAGNFSAPPLATPANDGAAATGPQAGGPAASTGPANSGSTNPTASVAASAPAAAETAAPDALASETSAATSESAAIRILGAASPSSAPQAYMSATEAATGEVAAAREDLAASPPALEAPSGISPESEAALGPVPTERAPVAAALPQSIDAISGQGSTPPAPDPAHDPAAGPIIDAPAGQVVVASAPDDPVTRAQFLQQQLWFAPVSDDNIDTSAGPRERVALSEEADPGRLAMLESSQDVPIGAQMRTASEGMCEDEGVDGIYPTLPDEMLIANFDEGSTRISPAGTLERPSLSAEFEGAIDQGGASAWGGVSDGLASQYDGGLNKRRDKEIRARADADVEIAGLNADAVSQQRGERIAAGEAVAEARAGWRSDIVTARTSYDGERGRVRTNMDRDIGAAVLDAQQKSDAQLAEGERQANVERAVTEKRAAEEKARADRAAAQSDGFFDWISSKVSDFFDALRSLLHDLFNLLRAAVRRIIEGAKALAHAAIELGRRAVVGLIEVAGGLLEVAADVFLGAFPEARDRAKALIREGTDAAVEGVNNAAQWLREKTDAVLDALGDALVAILDAYEAIYAAILNVIKFLVIGLVEFYRFMARLTEAAYDSPDHFEGQIYEEMLGADLTQPLPFELTDAEAAQLANGEGATIDDLAGMTDLAGGAGDAARVMNAPRLGDDDIVMDEVVPFEASPQLFQSMALYDGGTVEFDGAAGGSYSLDELRGEAMGSGGAAGVDAPAFGPVPADDGLTAPIAGNGPGASRPQNSEAQLQKLMNQDPESSCDVAKPTAETGPAIPLSAKIGPLTKSQRARYMLAQAWKGIKRWFACNWGKILLAVIAALVIVAAIVAAVVLSGGTVGALLAGAGTIATWLLTALTGAMIIYAIGRALSYIGDYLANAWNGRIATSAKALARAAAIGAVELIFAILTYVTAGAFKVLATAAKATGKAVVAVAKGAGRLAARGARAVGTGLEASAKLGGRVLRTAERGFVRLTGRVGRVLLVNGKLVIRNLRRGFARGVRSLRDLGQRIAKYLRFRKFRIKREGKWFLLQGEVNPWVTIAGIDASVWVDKVEKNISRPGKTPRSGNEVKILAQDGSSATGKVFAGSKSAPDYRDLAKIGGLTPKANVIHHAVEQQVLKRFPNAFTRAEINSLSRLRGIARGAFNSKVHLSRIRRLWNRMYEAIEARALTAAQQKSAISQFANKVDDFINHMNQFAATNSAFQAAAKAGNKALMRSILETEVTTFLGTSANPANAISAIMSSL